LLVAGQGKTESANGQFMQTISLVRLDESGKGCWFEEQTTNS
jgi:hypothetical protein